MLKDDTIDVIDIFDNHISSIFVNNHLVFEGVYPTNANTALVGGMHVRDAKPIEDEELKQWMDEATDGIIYMSFGSVRKILHFIA